MVFASAKVPGERKFVRTSKMFATKDDIRNSFPFANVCIQKKGPLLGILMHIYLHLKFKKNQKPRLIII